ncbi:hypothetical protein B0H66DRAFT_559685 [Apodospora peruviana]|uniref:X-Pro dipeptidyl-peptidase n=1 Tax=Apodospora peruviana TaxID=516989 RepID=A0AAE0HZR6_9PEZI|nr:hypothetical protein B0H66DRAFT_559685 [Apodospora peruviana]
MDAEATPLTTDWVDLTKDSALIRHVPIRIPPPTATTALKPNSSTSYSPEEESIEARITRIKEDESEVKRFFSITFSADRIVALRKLYLTELGELTALHFDAFTQDEKVDYLLLKNYLTKSIDQLDLLEQRKPDIFNLLPFAWPVTQLLQARQRVEVSKLVPKDVAQDLDVSARQAEGARKMIETGNLTASSKAAAYRTAEAARELLSHLAEFYAFFHGYDPQFDWWTTEPYHRLVEEIHLLISAITTHLIQPRGSESDEIIGDAIGRDALLSALAAEYIPYSPEELIRLAWDHYDWCLTEMRAAATELLGYTGPEHWRTALELVKSDVSDPGISHMEFIKSLVDEGAAYVKSHGLVTVPQLAEQTYRMTMISPDAQKLNPFFLGGQDIEVSYPSSREMDHPTKLMTMRANNRPMCRATVFHEMIPGHRLQMFMAARHRPYRQLFGTAFYTEGWAVYWEMLLWARGDFFVSPEARIGTLFWRMHRCARIIFSVKFHLGEASAEDCVRFLMDKVGHERLMAEGEVRRSLMVPAEYGPLYQAGYLLGAMQLWKLREEVIGTGGSSCREGEENEKAFHDRVLRAGEMPIEMLRALILGKELTKGYKTEWKFAGDPEVAAFAGNIR